MPKLYIKPSSSLLRLSCDVPIHTPGSCGLQKTSVSLKQGPFLDTHFSWETLYPLQGSDVCVPKADPGGELIPSVKCEVEGLRDVIRSQSEGVTADQRVLVRKAGGAAQP